MEKDPNFQMYASDVARNVPQEVLKSLVNLFMVEASLNMGNDFDDKTLDRVIYIIMDKYNHIPVNLIGSAFIRGSLGQFGSGRLIPRVVFGWLAEVAAEYNRKEQHDKQEKLRSVTSVPANLHKFPAGKAIIKKIDWYEAGLLSIDNWDRVNLSELATAIGEGRTPQFKDFFK